MLDPTILKDNIEVLKSNISRRNLKIDLNQLISLNEERKSLRFDAEQKRSQQKDIMSTHYIDFEQPIADLEKKIKS